MGDSWNSYVTSILDSKQVKDVAIVGSDGALWATSGGWNLTQTEINNAINLLAKPGTQTQFFVGGVSYFVLRGDTVSVYGKKGQQGVVLRATKQAVLIGQYDNNMQPGHCNTTVEKYAQHLLTQGY